MFRYVFDGINALQGLWVFLIFVCRPDAYKKIMKTTKLDTVFTSATKSRTGNIKVNIRDRKTYVIRYFILCFKLIKSFILYFLFSKDEESKTWSKASK